MRLTLIVSLCTSILLSSNAYAQKTVLITGGLTGIGKEITQEFKDNGWEVWATSRNPSKYPNIDGVKIRKLDVTNSSDIKALYNEIKQESKKLDVLINNAAYTVIGPEETLTLEQAREVMAVNVIGPLQMTQEALPIMRQNNGGRIINISSTSGIRALPGLGIYAASKMALEGLSEALAAETQQWNIWVSVIEPGAVKGNWVQKASSAGNLKEFPGYATFTNQLRRELQNRSEQNGQSPREIGKLAFKVANSPKPNMRYQTGSAPESIAKQVFVDPTGNIQRDSAAAFAHDLYDYHS